MTERLSSVLAEDTSAEFSPGGDFTYQIDSAVPVTIDVEVRMTQTLSWAGALSIRSDSLPVVRLSKVPYMRFKLRGNTLGNTVKIVDNS